MLINAAPRSYTSNIVADADLNLEGYNVTANAIYSKDNYLLTMLDYGEAFPTDVKEGDKLFAWGEDSTKSYIYTYKQGAWDAGVKPQHMQDYYIADENRTVKFCLLKTTGKHSKFVSIPHNVSSSSWYVGDRLCLVFGPDVYLVGSFSLRLGWDPFAESSTVNFYNLIFEFTNCTSLPVFSIHEITYSRQLSLSTSSESNREFLKSYNFPSGCNSFTVSYAVSSSTGGYGSSISLSYGFDE